MAKRPVTRREILSVAALTPMAAQTPPTAPAADDLEAARALMKLTTGELRKVQTPLLLEPSILFKPY